MNFDVPTIFASELSFAGTPIVGFPANLLLLRLACLFSFGTSFRARSLADEGGT
jgi:hypothetical protein